MKIIKLPTELNLDWSNFDWKVTTGFSLVGNRYVDRQLYKEYEVESIEQAINNLGKNASVLVHYHFKPINFSTMFRIYAVANLFSNRCTYKEREMIEGETPPFDLHLDDTFFEIWNKPWSEYSDNSDIYLRCGGIDKITAKKNWVNISNYLKKF
jgi:hypothetical protein